MKLNELEIAVRDVVNFHGGFDYADSKEDFSCDAIGDEFTRLIADPANSKGELYKISYAEDGKNGYLDPGGNTLLLQIVAQTSMQEDQAKINLAGSLFHLAVEDAKNKLSDQDFIEFINKKYTGTVDYYDNTPLTLAVKSGSIDIVQKLLDLGADYNQKAGYENCKMSAAELLAARVAVLRLAGAESLAQEGSLLDKIIHYELSKTSGNIDDILQASTIELPNIEEMKIFSVSQAIKENADFDQGKLSFNDLKGSDEFKQQFQELSNHSVTNLCHFLYESSSSTAWVSGYSGGAKIDAIIRSLSYDNNTSIISGAMLAYFDAPSKFKSAVKFSSSPIEGDELAHILDGNKLFFDINDSKQLGVIGKIWPDNPYGVSDIDVA